VSAPDFSTGGLENVEVPTGFGFPHQDRAA
jgi:hypothetical protein